LMNPFTSPTGGYNRSGVINNAKRKIIAVNGR